MVNGSLASRKPPGGGEPKERGDEENERESRSNIQGSGGFGGAVKGDKTLAELAEQITRASHPDHRMKNKLTRAADVSGRGEGPVRVRRISRLLHAEERTTGAGERVFRRGAQQGRRPHFTNNSGRIVRLTDARRSRALDNPSAQPSAA